MRELSVESAMSRAAERILSTVARPYDVAIDAMGELGGLLVEEQHAGVAYLLWAEISDLFDDPRGPGSEASCDRVARAAAADWRAVDRSSNGDVADYFARWDPKGGPSWVEHSAGNKPERLSAPSPAHLPSVECATEQYPGAEVDGFELGMFVSYDDCGDAWVKAPDGSVGTLIWETGEPAYFEVSIAPSDSRWRTYAVQLPLPLTARLDTCGYCVHKRYTSRRF